MDCPADEGEERGERVRLSPSTQLAGQLHAALARELGEAQEVRDEHGVRRALRPALSAEAEAYLAWAEELGGERLDHELRWRLARRLRELAGEPRAACILVEAFEPLLQATRPWRVVCVLSEAGHGPRLVTLRGILRRRGLLSSLMLALPRAGWAEGDLPSAARAAMEPYDEATTRAARTPRERDDLLREELEALGRLGEQGEDVACV